MNEASTTPMTLTIGIDLGDRKSHACVLDAGGEVVEESRIATTAGAMRARFEGLTPTRIALEVGGQSAWVSELLRELGHEVLVANARKLRMIFQSDSKNDRFDAEQLARVARMDARLLYPIEHRNRSARADLAVMRSRDALVAMRTRLVNHVHGVLKSFGHRSKKYAAPAFHRRVRERIPEELRPALLPLLDTLAAIAVGVHRVSDPRERRFADSFRLVSAGDLPPESGSNPNVRIRDPGGQEWHASGIQPSRSSTSCVKPRWPLARTRT